ncbi:MAG: hypothetical protein K2X81_23680 [Candidatus Obscuribacterales bacterium]|nr:hypothetical protein [Candidatus Obscuribacterales bacterium]
MDPSAANHKPGQCLWCRIDSPEPGGYAITIVKSGVKGFLPCTTAIDVGRIVPSTFVCMNGNRALFTFAFTLGTSARVQNSTASDQENAFVVWSEAHADSAVYRRAVDIIMPSIGAPPIITKLTANSAKEIFSTVEETKFTGCIKIYCQSSLSRSALIFLNGRVVGTIYTTKTSSDSCPIAVGIKKMLADVLAPDVDADMEMYELPQAIVLSLSSLFLGYVDQPEAYVGNLVYAERIQSHFSRSRGTGCLSLLNPKTDSPVALGFISEGRFRGIYSLDQKTFAEEEGFLKNMLLCQTQLKLQTHILPTAMTTDAVRFGYSLNSGEFGSE